MIPRSVLVALATCGLNINARATLPITVDEVHNSVVDLNYSQYRGTPLSSGVTQYLGMRYAAPPLGDRRLRAPIDPAPTVGVQNATSYKPVCLGSDLSLTSAQAEDCLYISVYTPSTATPLSKLPVWFYIEGGGYNGDVGATYNGSGVVKNSGMDIVFVEFTYRVGSWGFSASEKLRENGDLNVGLLDQRKALEWVHQHITQFGGDPDHVVIHGISARAGSVALQLAAYGQKDPKLFVGAIIESNYFPTQPKTSELEWQFDRYLSDAGCKGTTDELRCLRGADLDILQAANKGSPYPGQTQKPLSYWVPTVDGVFLPDFPYNLYEQGRYTKVPMMIGNVNDEGTYFVRYQGDPATPSDVADFFKRNYPHLTTQDTDAINRHYPLMEPYPTRNAYFGSAVLAYGESTLVCPGNFIASSTASTHPVWNYNYNVTDRSFIATGFGVPHTFEVAAVFGMSAVGDKDSSYHTYNKNIIPVVMNYWISFVKALDPNTFKHQDALMWAKWGTGEEGNRLVLQTNNSIMDTVPKDQVKRCAFWRTLVGDTEQ